MGRDGFNIEDVYHAVIRIADSLEAIEVTLDKIGASLVGDTEPFVQESVTPSMHEALSDVQKNLIPEATPSQRFTPSSIPDLGTDPAKYQEVGGVDEKTAQLMAIAKEKGWEVIPGSRMYWLEQGDRIVFDNRVLDEWQRRHRGNRLEE